MTLSGLQMERREKWICDSTQPYELKDQHRAFGTADMDLGKRGES
ncbi:uncharacterized protein FTOL_08052 [Fusarium torulosum]|uniref:Uncharacterized protein n=1 Tax=Fusarium torulosum TaxID=33205 RepID=A0AAE8MBU7_9HYPO|nr:uncharacterized protein FTOL_08052 [Fusarium torulosum]